MQSPEISTAAGCSCASESRWARLTACADRTTAARSIRDPQRIEQRLDDDPVWDPPVLGLAKVAAIGEQQHDRHAATERDAGDVLGGHPQARVLHDQRRLLSAEPRPGADREADALVAHRDVLDVRILLDELVEVALPAVGQARDEVDPGFLEPRSASCAAPSSTPGGYCEQTVCGSATRS